MGDAEEGKNVQTDIRFEREDWDRQLSVCSHFLKESFYDRGRMGVYVNNFLGKLTKLPRKVKKKSESVVTMFINIFKMWLQGYPTYL